MADFAPLPSPLPKASFFVFTRELFALLDAPFAACEADGERFSEYTQDTAPSYASREGCRWKDGERVAEVCHHEEHCSGARRERLEAQIGGLPGGCAIELRSGDGDTSALDRSRVVATTQGQTCDVELAAAERARVSSAVGAALAAALVLATHRDLGGARGAS